MRGYGPLGVHLWMGEDRRGKRGLGRRSAMVVAALVSSALPVQNPLGAALCIVDDSPYIREREDGCTISRRRTRSTLAIATLPELMD